MADFRLFLPDDRGILATLDEQGILTFVVLAGEDSPIRGTEMFDLMMRAFGKSVLGIRGVWRKGFQGQASVNLDKVNELTVQGVSFEEAIRNTWTATRAKRWGFTRVTVLGVPQGSPGAFTKIDLLFEHEASAGEG